MKYVAIVGPLDEGLTFYGPFDNVTLANKWLRSSGSLAHIRGCEILPMWEISGTTTAEVSGYGWVLVVGSFDRGFKLYGAFDSVEHAEEHETKFGATAIAQQIINPERGY